VPVHFLRAGRQNQSQPDRLIGFSDGVFAVAITLIALQFEIPRGLSTDQFLAQFSDELQKLPAYVISFWLVGLFWQIHHRMFEMIPRQNSTLVVINLAFLGAVCFIPFVSSLYGEYVDNGYEIAVRVVALYAVTMVTVGLLLAACWWYASWNHRLIPPDVTAAMIHYQRARGLVMPLVFSLSIPLAFWVPEYALLTWIVLPFAFVAINMTWGKTVDEELAELQAAVASEDEGHPAQ
jgi:uncharacterized membrane protein